MKAQRFAGITEAVRQQDGTTRRVQCVSCTHEGCDSTIEFAVTKDRRPPEVVFNLARRKGWTIQESRNSFSCPKHRKEPNVATKTTDTRQPSLEQRRAIFREIDESYVNRSYVEGVTDKTIGDKLTVPWAWVKTIREENFGPAGPDPSVLAAMASVKELEGRIAKMETDALAAFEGSVRQIGDVAEQLAAVKASLLRFAS